VLDFEAAPRFDEAFSGQLECCIQKRLHCGIVPNSESLSAVSQRAAGRQLLIWIYASSSRPNNSKIKDNRVLVILLCYLTKYFID
jgi:hypothetical protein